MSLRRLPPILASSFWFVVVIAVGCGVWEAYKAIGQAFNDRVPGLGWTFPVATDDISLPHITTIIESLFQPVGTGSQLLLTNLLTDSLITLKEAVVALLAASIFGLFLALLFLRVRSLSRGLFPWVVASQTIPLVAVAPMVVIWGGKAGLPGWAAVVAIAAFLAFFPVTVSALRGLAAVEPVALEMMHSIGAGPTTILRLLRVPNSLPYVFVGLRLAATASVVGAVVGELSAGTGKGLGAAILNFSYYYSIGPAQLYAAVLVASLTGMLFVGSIWVIELVAFRHRPRK